MSSESLSATTKFAAQVRSLYLFSALDEQQLVKVLESAQVRTLHAGETLFEHSRPAEQFFWLQRGLLKLFRLSPTGDEKIFEIVGPGQTFAEALMFTRLGSVYPVSAQAIEESVVVGFSNAVFADLLRQSIDSCFRMMANMSQRLHRQINEIDRLTLQNASERVIHYLLQQAAQERGSASVQLQVAKHVLASHLSIKPETLSRIFTRLTNKGLIAVQGAHIELPDLEGLRKELLVPT